MTLRKTIITALGHIISFRGKEDPTDLPKLEKKVHPALSKLLLSQQEKFIIRLAALDALCVTGR
ncbi:MAG: hypothetical protein D3903_18960 [Candidatus Electrothrix sp. GM3_4]|nr:hypothetical protein [Candidatus Electrothrix sp. GM3_4]